MDNKDHKSRNRSIRDWFKRKNKEDEQFDRDEATDWGEDDGEDYPRDVLIRLPEIDPCFLTNELRVFVGTWNVAGRSPGGSLAADVDEWLNLKDAADIYVLGFQEIVPLKPMNIIRAEDRTEAINWNLLIGKTLNDKYECPQFAPLLTPVTSDNYYYTGVSDSERRPSLGSQIATPARGQPGILNQEPYGGRGYQLMASKKMVGVFITVWMKMELLRRYTVSNVKVCSVACGIMGYLGNKGSVSVSMSIGRTSFCFVAAHLASGEKRGDEKQRNHQVSEIFRRTFFHRLPLDGDNHLPLTILGHDRIFWFGDLNYRLCLEDNLARQLIEEKDWRALQVFDQLQKELEDGGVFQGWREGNIEFPPTYKYSSSNCNRYSGGIPSRAGEKQRTPAWYSFVAPQ